MYKQSLYNLFVPYKEKIIYYNSLNETLFLLTLAEHDKMKEQFADPISFELTYPSVFDQFARWGFFVSEGVDEREIFRYRYHQTLFGKRDYHLVVVAGVASNIEYPFDDRAVENGLSANEWVTVLEKHIHHVVTQKQIPALCLEWAGEEPMLFLDEVITPVTRYARQLCEENQIAFQCQMETNGTLLTAANREKLKAIGLNRFSIAVECGEAKHDKIRHENGLPTFRRICENIKAALSEWPEVQIRLEVRYDTNDPVPELQSVLNRFEIAERQRICLDIRRVALPGESRFTPLSTEKQPELKAHGFQYAGAVENGWQTVESPRLYQNTVLYTGQCYCGKSESYTGQVAWGALDVESGAVVWDETERAKRIGSPWFENQHCLECPFLPLLHPVCAEYASNDTKWHIENNCILKNSTFNPASLVVQRQISKQIARELSR